MSSIVRRIAPYALSVALAAAALGLGFAAHRFEADDVVVPLFLMAIATTIWYGGTGPGILAIAVAAVCVNYFFTVPLYSFEIDPADRLNFGVFVLFAGLIGWFASRRRRIEEQLRQARDALQAEVLERTRQGEEIRTLNRDLERRSRELEATNKELEAFAYSTSHDLRAPLRHVAGYSELLQKSASTALDDKSRRYVTMILESAERMGNLIDDLLSFSRIGRAEKVTGIVDLGELVHDVVREAERDRGPREIRWRIGPLPRVQGDRAMLRVALFNLISNAVKYTRMRADAEIEIGSRDGKDGEIVVYVRDNGVGFDMKYVSKLFGVFQRLHRSSAFEGTGIGLATVQRIVARHGGRAWADGVVDGGATFYFSIPSTRGES